MRKELELAFYLGLTSKMQIDRIVKLLEANYELNTTFHSYFDLDAIITFLIKDKKNSDKEIHWVSIEHVGKWRLDTFGSNVETVLKVLASDYQIERSQYFGITEDPILIDHKGSKSITNRALIVATLCNKNVKLSNISPGKDTSIMLNALNALGVKIQMVDHYSAIIHGTGGIFKKLSDTPTIYLGNSGTSSRFLLPLFCLFPCGTSVIFKSDSRLNERPIKPLIDCLVKLKLIKIEYFEEGKIFPCKVTSLGESKSVKDFEIDCSETSQFVSALCLVAPWMGADQISIDLTGNIVSESYIFTTFNILKAFGAKAAYDACTKFVFVKSFGYMFEEEEYIIEWDMSTAAFDVAYSAIFGQPITIANITSDWLQGEFEFIQILAKYFKGFKYIEHENSITIKGTPLGKVLF
jgi:3-phosphoshikimate 1-carboxyvinyltransferase